MSQPPLRLSDLAPQDRVRILLRRPLARETDGHEFGLELTGEYASEAGLHFVIVRQGLLPRAAGPISDVLVAWIDRLKTRAEAFAERFAAARGAPFGADVTRDRDGYETWLRRIAAAVAAEPDAGRSRQLRRQMDDVADEIALSRKKRAWLVAEAAHVAGGGRSDPSAYDLCAGGDLLQALGLERPRPQDFDPDPKRRRARTPPTPGRALLRKLKAAGFKAAISIFDRGLSDEAALLVTLPGGRRVGRAFVKGRRAEGRWAWTLDWHGNGTKTDQTRRRRALAGPDWARLAALLKEASEPETPAAAGGGRPFQDPSERREATPSSGTTRARGDD